MNQGGQKCQWHCQCLYQCQCFSVPMPRQRQNFTLKRHWFQRKNMIFRSFARQKSSLHTEFYNRVLKSSLKKWFPWVYLFITIFMLKKNLFWMVTLLQSLINFNQCFNQFNQCFYQCQCQSVPVCSFWALLTTLVFPVFGVFWKSCSL